MSASVIYEFSCVLGSTPVSYIGSTKRQLYRRVAEHAATVLRTTSYKSDFECAIRCTEAKECKEFAISKDENGQYGCMLFKDTQLCKSPNGAEILTKYYENVDVKVQSEVKLMQPSWQNLDYDVAPSPSEEWINECTGHCHNYVTIGFDSGGLIGGRGINMQLDFIICGGMHSDLLTDDASGETVMITNTKQECPQDKVITAGVQKAYAKDVTSLVAVLEELGNPFEEESKDDLIVLDTKEMAAPAVVETVRNALKIGKDQFELFTKDRLIDRSKSLHDVISRNKLPLFNTPTIKPVPKSKQALTTTKGDMELFSRMYIGCQTRDGNLDDFFQHENRAYPPSLSERGNLRLGSKSDLLNCMEELSKAKSDAPVVTSVILDGAAIVQMMKPGTTRTFDEYANVIFKPYISSQLQRARRLDLVWDSYVTDSLKSTARAKRGIGVRRRVVGSATTPANWQNFLLVDSNKTEFFQFLSMVLVESIFEHGKELVVTVGENVESTPLQEDLESLGPCNHEEADSRMFLHVAHASRHGHEKILVRTVDTDVVVLAVAVAQTLPADSELWLAFGTGTSFRYLAAHELAVSLGPDKSRALPMFHALTGCDTVSAFLGHGKRTAWATWKAMPELTNNTLLDLSSAPDDVPDDGMRVIERFVILMYDRTSTSHDVNLARKKIFGRKNSVQSIPPTRAALEQHVKRAVYQGGHVWGQLLLPQQVLPSPTRWGWVRSDDNQYQPFWTTLPEASRISIYDLSANWWNIDAYKCKSLLSKWKVDYNDCETEEATYQTMEILHCKVGTDFYAMVAVWRRSGESGITFIKCCRLTK
ncbi:hypothetical protein GQR58_003768 [Nymphon striatum]|nr:hypothetical protein GQR58_003768 [Nymphon striatum]